jgi:Spy/CpxP family protein refolding chaperone
MVQRPEGPGEPRMRRGPEGGGMPGMGMPGGKWWKDSQVVQQIALSDQQAQQIEKTFQDHRMQLIDLHANLEKAETQMEPLMQADQPNEAQVTSQIDKIAQARAALEKSNAQMLFAIRRILTPDQWKKLQNMHHEFPRPAGMGRGGPDGGFMGGRERAPRALRPGQAPPPAQAPQTPRPPQEPE